MELPLNYGKKIPLKQERKEQKAKKNDEDSSAMKNKNQTATNMTGIPFEKLARGSYYLILSNISNLAIGALFWVILAKMVDPTSLGQAMVVIALSTAVIGFSGFGVQVMLSKYIAEYNARNMPKASRGVFVLGIKLALIVSGSAALVISLLSDQISGLAYQDASFSHLLIFAAITFLPSQTMVSALMGAFQGAQRMEYSFLIFLIYELIRLAISVTLVLYGLGSFGIIVGFSAASVIASLLGFIHMAPIAVPKSSKEAGLQGGLGSIFKFSALNYISIGSRTLSTQIGVLILGTQNFEWAAFYGVSVLLATIIGGILSAVSRAILPTASEEWIKGNKTEFKAVVSTSIRLSLLISGFAFLILMIDPSFVLRLISESYIEASWALRILIVSAMMQSIGAVMISMLNAANRASGVAIIGLVSSSAIIGLTVVLAPAFGLEGAAFAMLVGSLAVLLLSLAMLKKKERLTISRKAVSKPAVSMLMGIFLGYSLLTLWDNALLAITVAVLFYAGFSILYRVTTESELKKLFAIVLRTRRS